LKEGFEDKDQGLEMEKMTIEAMGLLEQEAELLEIVRLVGAEALSPRDRLALESARSIREDYLHQNAFHDVDTHTLMPKQYEMLKTILHFHKQGLLSIDAGVETADIFKLTVREEIARAKYVPQDEIDKITEIRDTIEQQMKQLQTSVAA
jgi:V/A-type H+-transporting ATPase subunit A